MKQLEEQNKLEDIKTQTACEYEKYYVNFEVKLQKRLQILSEGCPISFMVHYYKSHIRDGILMVKDGGRAEVFLRAIYENLNGLLIITRQQERWETFAKEVYEQSGLILQYDSELNWRRKTWEKHYLFDFAYTTDEKEMHIRQLPRGIIYVDMMPSYEKQRVIEGKRKDITYIPCPKCLDTCQRCGV